MHLSPKFHPHQLKMPKDQIPGETLRKELSELDLKIIELVHRRQVLSEEVGAIKRKRVALQGIIKERNWSLSLPSLMPKN